MLISNKKMKPNLLIILLSFVETSIAVGSPRGLKVKDSSATELKLKWRRPKVGKHSIEGYKISWKMAGSTISDVKQTNLRTILINQLKPGTAYIFKVQTVATDGRLSEPAKISHRTKRKIIIPVPTNFTVDVYGSTKLVVKWNLEKESDAKKITGFQIQYRQKGAQKGTLCTVVTTKKKFKYIITDLYKGQQYKVRLAAKSGHLTGESTDWIVATLPGNNKNKQKEKGNKGSTLPTDSEEVTDDPIWTESPANTDINNIISVEVNKTESTYIDQNVTMTCTIRYLGTGERSILWSKGDDLKVERIGAWFIEISGRHTFEESFHKEGKSSLIISQLTLRNLRTTDSGQYTCHVLNTEKAATLSLTVTDASPGPPRNLDAEALSHNSIGLYWSPPINSAKFPVTYEVHCWRTRRQFEYDYQHVVVKNINQTQYVITSLDYATKYFIGVVAVNKYGRSNLTKFDNVTVLTSDLQPLEITDISIVNPIIFSSGNVDIDDTAVVAESSTPVPGTQYGTSTMQGTAVNISWDLSTIKTWPLMWTQHIVHYKTDDNSTIHHLSVWGNSTVIYNLEHDKTYYFRIETVFPEKSIYSKWRKFSTHLSEVTSPPPPKDMFLQILANDSLSITWLPPPEEYRVKVRGYQLAIQEEEGKKQFFKVGERAREYVIQISDRSKRQTVELTAINNAGESDKIVRVLDSHSHLYAEALTSTSVRVRWSTSSNSDLTRYLLRYRPIRSNASQPVDVFVKSSISEYTLNGLQEFTEYIISLISYYNDLPGNFTSATVRTLSDVPSAPPRDVNLETNNTTVIVSWKPPPEHTRNGELTFYRVEYKTKTDPVTKSMLVTETELQLTGLEEGVVYLIRVAAVTVNGSGPFSSWVHIVVGKPDTERPPDTPTNLTAQPVPLGIRLTWEPPQDTNIPVTGYIVGRGRFLPEVYRTILGPTEYQYTIEGLRPDAQYIFTVRSFNKFGESKPELIKARSGSRLESDFEMTTDRHTTPNTTPVPGAPYDIEITGEGQEVPTALVTWKRPNIKEKIKGYILLYTNDSSLPLYQWTGVFERSLQYTIKNLSFNTTYFLTIQTQIEDGTGVMSEMKYFTTRPVEKMKGTLPMPKILSAFSGEDYIHITWLPPDYAPIIRGYILGYGVWQPGEYQELLAFSETTFKIQKLAPDTMYHISLRSFGEFGESERAVISVSTTA